MSSGKAHTIYIVDDEELFGESLRAILSRQGFVVHHFLTAEEFLKILSTLDSRSLIISDINMPGLSGFELCKAIRGKKDIGRIPIILVSGNDENTKAMGLETGADELAIKPFAMKDFVAKIKSLVEIREKELETQNQLAQSNHHLKEIRRFLSPNVADVLTTDDYNKIMSPHRAQIAVLFTDLRGFTSFSENTEPEDVLAVLSEYYRAVGLAAIKHNGTLGHLAGDGIMVFFNDPVPVENHMELAVRTAIEAREELNKQKQHWIERNYRIDFGIGLSEGYATIGGIGFERFYQYSAIGSVTNFASRLCQVATKGQILVSERFLNRLEGCQCEFEPLGLMQLKGMEDPVKISNIISLKKTSIKAS